MMNIGSPKSLPLVATCMILGLVAVVTPGCGDRLASVTGTVTLDGQPLAGGENVRATVNYYPEGGTGAPAIGLLDEAGRYEIATGSQTGVRPGAYVVTISATELIPAQTPGAAPGGRTITPRKYADPRQSGFRVEVAPGSNKFDFDLRSAP